MLVVSIGPFIVCKTSSHGVAKATVSYLTSIGWTTTAIKVTDKAKVIKVADL